MLKGFRDFILRGNVIELSVAVVIGAAFTSIVEAFTDNIVNPLVAALGGDGSEVEGLSVQLISGNSATIIDFGKVISAAINFLLVAAVVYFILIAPMNKLTELKKKRLGVEAEEAEELPDDQHLLAEIRDLLKERAGELEEPSGRHSAPETAPQAGTADGPGAEDGKNS